MTETLLRIAGVSQIALASLAIPRVLRWRLFHVPFLTGIVWPIAGIPGP